VNVNQLHRALGKLIEAGHGRKPILVHKTTFVSSLEEDGVVMMPVSSVSDVQWIPIADDDGGWKLNRDGTESGQRVVILRGEGYDSSEQR
jgi:hypothetical protein